MFLLIRGIQVLIFLITFIYCLQMRNKVEASHYMKNFYWYPLVASVIGIFWILGTVEFVPNHLFNYLNSTSLIFHFAFLSRFIFKIINSKKIQFYLSIGFWLFLIVISFYLIKEFYTSSATTFVLTNIGLFIFCIFFYYDLLKHLPTYNLFKESAFWVVTGVFCGVCFNIPILLFGNYLVSISKDLYHTVGWLAPFGYMVMYLFFIKGIKCSTQILKK